MKLREAKDSAEKCYSCGMRELRLDKKEWAVRYFATAWALYNIVENMNMANQCNDLIHNNLTEEQEVPYLHTQGIKAADMIMKWLHQENEEDSLLQQFLNSS